MSDILLLLRDGFMRCAARWIRRIRQEKVGKLQPRDIVARHERNLSRDSTRTRNTNMILGPLTNIRVSIYLRASRARFFDRGRNSTGNRLVLVRAPSGLKPQDLNQFPFDKSSGDAGRRRRYFIGRTISLSIASTTPSTAPFLDSD